MTVTAASGFRAAGVPAGITGELDLALVVNDGPGSCAAGVFTREESPAAPVLWSRQVLTTGRLRAVVLNSGGANADTGPIGFQTTHAVAEQAAQSLGCGAIEVAVCSTGPVGVQLPRDAVLAGVRAAALGLAATARAGTDAAAAVADRPLEALYRDADGWLLGGFVSSGPPSTVLAVLTTDADADPADLDAALREVGGATFPGRGTDGSSGNDTVLLLCSGGSGRRAGRAGLTTALAAVCATLVDRRGADEQARPISLRHGRAGASSEQRGADPA